MISGKGGQGDCLLIDELDAMRRLHGMASRFVREGNLPDLLSDAIDTAMAIVGADMGFIATLAGTPAALKVAAHRGDGCAETAASLRSGRALQEAHLARRERIVVGDTRVDHAPGAVRDLLPTSEIRAFQSTPLRSPDGELVGLLATHHRRPWSPGEKELHLLDLVARQCNDAIERAAAMEAYNLPRARAQADKLRETEELFRTTVENMPDNLILYGRDGRIVYLNPALARICPALCGRTAPEILGQPGEEVWPATIWIPLRIHTERAIATGERQTYDLAVTLPDGRQSVRQWTVVPLTDSDGETRQILAMSHDMTAQRLLVDELREADERKSAFIAMLSHELRNPLAAIRTNLYVLEHATPGNEPAVRATKVIDRQIGHLVGMVDGLLDVTRITQNKIQLRRERIDVNALVRETIEDNRPHLERGGVTFSAPPVDRPLYVDADGARIAQVVTNLLTNAAKFTPPGGKVRVSIGQSEGRWAVLKVSDSGSGIESSLLPHLFQPFMQGDRSLERTAGGLGLGLALVKGLVELHGGDVTASSGGPGQGAEFVVRLPLEQATLGDDAGGVTEAPGKKRVLVIEDDIELAEGLQAALQIDNHDVEIARSGRSGLEKARAFKPDAVLCDIGLPGMDGYAVARAFRADEALRVTFLVALSGYAQAEDVAKARAAGFDRHLAKPASLDKIHGVIAASTAAREEDFGAGY
jgi:PAS domain S-box-containing protein